MQDIHLMAVLHRSVRQLHILVVDVRSHLVHIRVFVHTFMVVGNLQGVVLEASRSAQDMFVLPEQGPGSHMHDFLQLCAGLTAHRSQDIVIYSKALGYSNPHLLIDNPYNKGKPSPQTPQECLYASVSNARWLELPPSPLMAGVLCIDPEEPDFVEGSCPPITEEELERLEKQQEVGLVVVHQQPTQVMTIDCEGEDKKGDSTPHDTTPNTTLMTGKRKRQSDDTEGFRHQTKESQVKRARTDFIVDNSQGDLTDAIVDSCQGDQTYAIVDSCQGNQTDAIVDSCHGDQTYAIVHNSQGDQTGAIVDSCHGDQTYTIVDNNQGDQTDAIVDNSQGDQTDTIVDSCHGDQTYAIVDNSQGDQTCAIVDNSQGDQTGAIVDSCHREQTYAIVDSCQGDHTDAIVDNSQGDQTGAIVDSYHGKQTNAIVDSCQGDQTDAIVDSCQGDQTYAIVDSCHGDQTDAIVDNSQCDQTDAIVDNSHGDQTDAIVDSCQGDNAPKKNDTQNEALVNISSINETCDLSECKVNNQIEDLSSNNEVQEKLSTATIAEHRKVTCDTQPPTTTHEAPQSTQIERHNNAQTKQLDNGDKQNTCESCTDEMDAQCSQTNDAKKSLDSLGLSPGDIPGLSQFGLVNGNTWLMVVNKEKFRSCVSGKAYIGSMMNSCLLPVLPRWACLQKFALCNTRKYSCLLVVVFHHSVSGYFRVE